MSKASERSAERWRTLEEALISHGPKLYTAVHRAAEPNHASELWVSAFVRAFEADRDLYKAPGGYLWLVEQVLAAAAAQGVSVDGAALLAQPQPQTQETGSEARTVDASTDRNLHELARLAEAALQIPEEDWNALRKRLLAREAAWDAETRRRGGSWSQYAVIAAAVVGLAGVVYGIADLPASGASVGATDEHSHLVARLPQPLTNLPTVTDAQFRLHGTSVPSFSHAYVTSDTLYLPQLSKDGGVYQLTILEAPFAATGREWGRVARSEGKLLLTPPTVTGQQQGSPQLANWRFIVSGRYAVVVASWSLGQSQLVNAVQVYQLDLQTSRTKLLKNLSAQSSGNDTYVTAVGDGKVIIQPGILEGLGNSAAMVGLPIQEYTLDATPPSQALAHAVQIPGTFGLMQEPAITTNGIVFQGIDGQPQDPAAVSSTWYQLSWNGSLATLQGPPLDNQQHWTVTGRTGQLWWVETTPAASGADSGSQVLMGRVTALGAAPESPAETLSGPVLAFGVSGSHLIWVQRDAGVSQVVVSEVTQ